MSESNKMTGGDAITRILQNHGLKTVFALAGASHTHLLDALNRNNFRIVSTRHETGTVCAADGYARITGKIGIALVISDQGLANTITGLATAFHACSPILLLVASTPESWREPNTEHSPDPFAQTRSITKWAHVVPSRAQLGEFVETAIRRATTGRPGPVALSISSDFLAQRTSSEDPINQSPSYDSRSTADPALIQKAADLINQATRPVIIGGAGAAWGKAEEYLTDLCHNFNIPYLGNTFGRGLVPEDDHSSYPWSFAHPAAKEADLVISVGARFKQLLGWGQAPRFRSDAKFIQVDIDPTEPGRTRPVDVPLIGDSGLISQQLVHALYASNYKPKKDPSWVQNTLKHRYDAYKDLGKNTAGAIHPFEIARAVEETMPKNAIYVGDGGDIQFWMFGCQRITTPRTFLDPYPLFSIGIGIPLALGAAAAASDIAELTGETPSPVVLLTGDGSFGFYCGELASFQLAGLNATVLIANDAAWGMELHGQNRAIGRNINTLLDAYDYEKVAQGFGWDGEKIEGSGNLLSALRKSLNSKTPTLLNVIVDQSAGEALRSDPHLENVILDPRTSKA